MNKIQKLSGELRQARMDKKFADKRIKELQADLVEALKEFDDEYVDGDNRTYVVRPKRVSYKWDLVQKKVGPLRWKKICKLVPDEELLNVALTNGTIKPSFLKDCIEETETSPYVKEGKVRQDEEELD